jgi:transposase
VDGSQHKAPAGGEGTGKNPTHRAKLGWKWSVLTEANGIPIGWAIDGANRHDSVLLPATLAAAARRGLLEEIETIWLDRGYDSGTVRAALVASGIDDAVIAKRRKTGTSKSTPAPRQPMGLRWPVERTNSWLSNFERFAATTHERSHTASPSLPWRWPSSSRRSSSTGETAGCGTFLLSAEPLNRRSRPRRHHDQAVPAALRRIGPHLGLRHLPGSHDDYEDSNVPSGMTAGTAKEALDCASGLYVNRLSGWIHRRTNARHHYLMNCCVPGQLRTSSSPPNEIWVSPRVRLFLMYCSLTIPSTLEAVR